MRPRNPALVGGDLSTDRDELEWLSRFFLVPFFRCTQREHRKNGISPRGV